MVRYWFPAKRHGWGWSPPSTWEGRLTLAGFVALIAVGAFIVPPSRSLLMYLGYVFVLAAGLVGICWLKGEPPHRR
jgi:hypothetical protein